MGQKNSWQSAETDRSAVWWNLFRSQPPGKKLTVEIPAGIIPPNPSELLGSDKNKELLEILKKEYDLIIIDCPPVNAVTDSLVLATLADEAIIVSRYKKTPIDLLQTTKKALETSEIKIAGIVMNRMERTKDKYYYNKYYN